MIQKREIAGENLFSVVERSGIHITTTAEKRTGLQKIGGGL
jgi:hypothetical protein